MLQFINLTKSLNYKPKYLVTDLPYLNSLSAHIVQLMSKIGSKSALDVLFPISERKPNKKARKPIICEKADRKKKYIYTKMYTLEFSLISIKTAGASEDCQFNVLSVVP